MVDQTNIARIQLLLAQRQNYRQARAIFDEGGGIRAFVIQTPEDETKPSHQTWVEAAGINYPPAMIEGIKQQLNTRLIEIESELAALGVTGLDTGPPFASISRDVYHR